MNPIIKAKWIAALRSGRYMQGCGRLVQRGSGNLPSRYCCLGVLCELAANENVCKRTHFDSYGAESYDGQAGTLPISVMKWAELKYANPAIGESNLVHENDDTLLSFPSIADLIEQHL